MEALFQPWVLAGLAVAILIGFLIGRMGRSRRVDPSDFSHSAQPRPGRIAAPDITIAAVPQIDVPMPPEVLAYIQQGKLIDAIKALRQAHPELGLKEAKDAVDLFRAKNGL